MPLLLLLCGGGMVVWAWRSSRRRRRLEAGPAAMTRAVMGVVASRARLMPHAPNREMQMEISASTTKTTRSCRQFAQLESACWEGEGNGANCDEDHAEAEISLDDASVKN